MVNFNQTFYINGGNNNIVAVKFTKILCKVIHCPDQQICDINYYFKSALEPNVEHSIGLMEVLVCYSEPTLSSKFIFGSKLNTRRRFFGEDEVIVYDIANSVLAEIERKYSNLPTIRYGWDAENLCVKETRIDYTYDLISKTKFVEPRTLKWLDEKYPYLCEQDAIDNNKPSVIEFEEEQIFYVDELLTGFRTYKVKAKSIEDALSKVSSNEGESEIIDEAIYVAKVEEGDKPDYINN